MTLTFVYTRTQQKLGIRKLIKKNILPETFILQDHVDDVDLCLFSSRVEKYRPQKLDDLISHKDILSTSKLKFHHSGSIISKHFNILLDRTSLSVADSYLSLYVAPFV